MRECLNQTGAARGAASLKQLHRRVFSETAFIFFTVAFLEALGHPSDNPDGTPK